MLDFQSNCDQPLTEIKYHLRCLWGTGGSPKVETLGTAPRKVEELKTATLELLSTDE